MMKKFLILLFLLTVPFVVEAMPINIQPNDSDSFILELESSDTVEAVKEKIYNYNNKYVQEDIILSFNNVVMENGRILSDYEVQENNIIYLTLIEEYTVIFDANEGTFIGGNILTIDKWANGMESNLEMPTREGYKFLGFYTDKIGGTKLEFILAESGIDSDRTFYAQWEKIVEEVVPPVVNEPINPNTINGLDVCICLLFFSFISFISLIIYGRKEFNN